MAAKSGAHGDQHDATVDALLALQQRNVEAMTGAVKLALEGLRRIASRQGDFVSEAHRHLALLLWRGTMTRQLNGAPAVSLEIVKRALDTSLAHAVTVSELAAQLQRQGLTMFGRSVCDCLSLLEGAPPTGKAPGTGS